MVLPNYRAFQLATYVMNMRFPYGNKKDAGPINFAKKAENSVDARKGLGGGKVKNRRYCCQIANESGSGFPRISPAAMSFLPQICHDREAFLRFFFTKLCPISKKRGACLGRAKIGQRSAGLTVGEGSVTRAAALVFRVMRRLCARPPSLPAYRDPAKPAGPEANGPRLSHARPEPGPRRGLRSGRQVWATASTAG